MPKLNRETVTNVHHWNDTLFSFRTTRDPGFRFHNGYFTMVGLEVDGKPLLRAYSIASANYEEEMEFFSIKVEDGPLTSRLQHLKVGDEVLIGKKPIGSLTTSNILPGKHLYLLATGTGLAPFLGIIKDPEIYEQFDKVILVHGVRHISDLAYHDVIDALPNNEYFGDMVRDKLLYYPSVTREDFRHRGRITHLIESGVLFSDLGLPEPTIEDDRFMLCGGPAMLKDLRDMLTGMGFVETHNPNLGQFVIERAFVSK